MIGIGVEEGAQVVYAAAAPAVQQIGDGRKILFPDGNPCIFEDLAKPDLVIVLEMIGHAWIADTDLHVACPTNSSDKRAPVASRRDNCSSAARFKNYPGPSENQ
ncbi:hypothetical protein LAC81_37780 (plasmid) [Ensifer adhaerens]|uniref:hypothetical protein n=1 Tax=Ensifer adhaerens TaxID=106592 RepID=UPI001CBA83BF|nr:hypothetical protein [Ensifer adhaerens]UAX98084.1 hypothetical protein LAC78_39080 [Ensifer adhaerens]UAY05465.1 hypothetical protein LAC80_37795 [Ensifer adhaerens]UAY12843.1 hypothetical protein LAC81_37780 [Ensifer adhaerens]